MAGVRVDIVRSIVLRAIALFLALGFAVRADAQLLGPPPVNRLPSAGPSLTTGPREGSVPTTGGASSPGAAGGTYVPVSPKEQLADTPIDPLVEQNVVEIRVVGNETRSTAQILNAISTRIDRPFDQTALEKDVRTLVQKKWFLDIRPIREQVAGGVRITIEVIERPSLLYVKYLGNSKIKDKRLAKETDLKRGSSLDPYAVEEGRRKIEEYYKSKGYNDCRVVVLEGTKPGDRGAIYMINEGNAQKIKKTTFVGATITSEQRLKTQIESKPPILGIFKGQYSEDKVNEDIDKLITYYRSLGFFRTRISRQVVMDENWKRPTLTFVIDEGPRYRVREVSFIGNRKFNSDQLRDGMALKEGEFFLRRNLDQDITRVQDVYGTQGYVFANIQQELRFEEEPGELNVVFSVEEGSRYAIGEIHVHIAGDTPHTRFNAVLNRLMFRPGDVINTRLIRNAERRLKASALFVNDPAKGQIPKITFTPPGEEEETGVADRPSRRARGQSPDDADVKKLDMHVHIHLNPEAPAGPDEPLGAEPVEPAPQKTSWWPLRLRTPEPPPEEAPSQAVPIRIEPRPATPRQTAPGPAAPARVAPGQAQPVQAAPARTAPGQTAPRPAFANPNAPPQAPRQTAPGPLPPSQAAPPQTAPPQAAPRQWPLQSSSTLPRLDIAADEVLIVRGQGPSYGANPPVSTNGLPAPRISNTAPNDNSTSTARVADPTSAPTAGKPPAQPTTAKGLTATLTSLNLTAPVSLGQSLNTARWAGAAPPRLTLDPMASKIAPGQSTAAAPAPPAAVTAPAPTQGSQRSPASPSGSNSANSQSSFSVSPWTVRGQSQFGGRLLQPISPGPQSSPAYAPGSSTSGYSGAAFQSPGPTDPTATEEPEALPALPINVATEETQTGRFMFGVGVNSNAGIVGSIVVDEQNFDFSRLPTSMEDWRNGTAFRGAGQHFRIELAPGTQMSRYLISFNNPYLFDTNVSYGTSAYYFQRFYYDWYEQRMGGNFNLGYQFRPDLVGSVNFGAENVRIEDPRILIPDLAQVKGNNGRFSFGFAAANDTRDNTFFPTEGRYIKLAYDQVTGSFTYPRITLDMRKYFVMHQRADGSGRQVLALYSYTGVSGANTPIYDRFFLGGIGTIRGFYYRDASPTYDTVVDGGDFASYGTIEYTVPITADDMFRLAFFVDGGFDSRTARVEGDDIRIAPGIGIRVSVPAMGPAPISVDFAFPVVKNVNDQNQLVNFAVGVAR